MNYCIFDAATGEIKRWTSHEESRMGETCIKLAMLPGDWFIDVVTQEPVRMPERRPQCTVFDWGMKQWVDRRSLAEIKADKWAEIKAARLRAETLPIVVGGCSFDADLTSQQKIYGQVLRAQLAGESWSIDWTLWDNTEVTLTAAQMVAVGVALGQRTAGIYATARTLREQIDAAPSQAELEAIAWPSEPL